MQCFGFRSLSTKPHLIAFARCYIMPTVSWPSPGMHFEARVPVVGTRGRALVRYRLPG